VFISPANRRENIVASKFSDIEFGITGTSQSLTSLIRWCAGGLLVQLLAGCAIPPQEPDEVLVREAGERHYAKPATPLAEEAKLHWEFAALSENAYFPRLPAQAYAKRLDDCAFTAEEKNKICHRANTRDGKTRLQPAGWRWKPWADFPSAATWCKAQKYGLDIEVHEDTSTESGRVASRVAVIFRGTESPDLNDWRSNFRWITRFFPGEDEYTVAVKDVTKDLAAEVARRQQDGRLPRSNLMLFASGHSLGGGLAQQLAYAYPPAEAPDTLPKISTVYAFDPSPVTGWFTIEKTLREKNAGQLKIDRIFEHGEALAYVRLLLSYALPPQANAPAISEVRYDVVPSNNPVGNHSMGAMALKLAEASGHPQTGTEVSHQACACGETQDECKKMK
jgi:hypothetical protein